MIEQEMNKIVIHTHVIFRPRNAMFSLLIADVIRKEENNLFNNTLNTFYWRLHGVRRMLKHHSDSERENSLLPLGYMGYFFQLGAIYIFICTIPQTG